MKRTPVLRIFPATLLAAALAFAWTVAAASGSPPGITVLTASEEDGQFSSPFTGFGTAVAIDGDTAWVGIPLYVNSAESPTQSGRVGIFTFARDSGAWVRSGSLDVSDQQNDEQRFGSSVVLRKHDAAVGSYDAVRIYSRTREDSRVLAKIASDASNHVLGPVLAYDGDTLAVQVTDTQSPQTLVYVYEIDHRGDVHLTAKLSPPPEDTGAFGSSLAVDGDTLLVGSPGGYSISSVFPPGAAYIYSAHKGTWQLTQTLSGSEASENSDFGAAVAIRGDVILVGAPYEDVVSQNDYTSAAGAVYVFRRDRHGPWIETQRVRPTEQDTEIGAFRGFGWSLAMGDKRVTIGAPLTIDPFQSELGQTDVYRWQGNDLVFEQRLRTPGFSLSMSREQLIIGVNTFVHAPINYAWIVDFGNQGNR